MTVDKEVNLTGMFTLTCERGKPYLLNVDDDALRRLGLPTDLTPEELYYVWLEHVRAEDRATVEKAIRGVAEGFIREVRFGWRHDTLGRVYFSCAGMLSEHSGERIVIKGIFKNISEPDMHGVAEDNDILLFKTLLMDVIIESFTMCALSDIRTNRIYFLSDNIFGTNMHDSITYDEWRENFLKMTVSDDADLYRRMSVRQRMPEYFDRFDNEFQFEVRYNAPNGKGIRKMRQRYMRFSKPLAGQFGEFIVFIDVKNEADEGFRRSMHRRLLDGLALPYRNVDLINLRSGKLYSLGSEPGQRAESLEELRSFDETIKQYLDECDLTEEQREENLNKFLTRNMLRHFEDGVTLLESELRHKRNGEYEWVRVQAFQSAADEERSPYMAIATILPINEEKEKELRGKERLEFALRSERQYKKAILSTAMVVYTSNVTKDILFEEIIEQEGTEPLLPKMGLGLPCSFNEYVNRKSKLITSKQEADFFRKTFNTRTLLDMFNSKRYTFDNEYEFMVAGKKGVFREAVILTKDIKTDEIWGLTTIRNITHERNESKRIEQALRDAFYQAKNANNAKTLFMSQMSHDIRTPLNSILGMAAIAREHIDDRDRVDDCMEKIDFAGRHLLEVINNVLDLSAIESGKTMLVQEDFNLRVFLDDTMKMVYPLAERRGQTVETEYGEFHDNVSGDRTKLRQLLVNVLSNAIKYTPNGGRIKLTVDEPERDRHDVFRYKFTIEDNGIGIPKEFLDKIFDPFARVDNHRTGNAQGTGLGMPIAQNIARMMNGDIHVKSEVGKGSVFEITVCLKRSTKSDNKYISEISMAAPKKVRMSDFDFGGRTVLLAEDLSFNAEIAAEFLNEANINVEFAENGAEAVKMFGESDKGHYSLIFMDIQMPELDGYEATKRIRALDRADARDIPIIAMTANAFIEDIEHSIESGMNGHIAKPIEIPKLAQILTSFFGSSQKLSRSDIGAERREDK